jgi:hypothetical protein
MFFESCATHTVHSCYKQTKNIAELSRPQTLVAWFLMGQLSTKELNRASYQK